MTPYQQLRAALLEELGEPGAVTKDELRAVLDRFPEQHPDDQPPPAGPPADGLLRLG